MSMQLQFDGSRKFTKGKRLEDEEQSGQLLEVDNDQLRAILKLILLQLCEVIAEELNINILWSFSI